MHFRIADTFTDSLARLQGDEQKAAKTTAFDLQLNPANPGMKFHKLDRARDANFWSVRVNRDIRVIVHRTKTSLLLCFVGHHDEAYRWAERRKLERHPKTRAAQLVEVRETVEEIRVPRYVEAKEPAPAEPPPLATLDVDDLLVYGVPEEWTDDLMAADEDQLLELAEHLPAEAAEAVLTLAAGERPPIPEAVEPDTDPFEHPDAQRRFRLVADSEELQQALEFPWEKWSVYLHPAQRELVERDFNGPARVAGSAGTGKTVVALHRAVYLARVHSDSRVLLATFSEALANMLDTKLKRLAGHQPRVLERIEVHSLDAMAERLYRINFAAPSIADPEDIENALDSAVATQGELPFSRQFVLAEWYEIIDAWQIQTWEAYRDFSRRGRKSRLAESQRESLWAFFEEMLGLLEREGKTTRSTMYAHLAEHYQTKGNPPFEYFVIDEAQDVSVPQLRFLAAMAGERPNGLFFAGDQGQRIFQAPFSWRALGVDVRGRARVLHVNYRTSHQIRSQADRLLDQEVSDLDGNIETRNGTVSVFSGPPATIQRFDSAADEAAAVGAQVSSWAKSGIDPQEMAIFVRSEEQTGRAEKAAECAGLATRVLDESLKTEAGHLNLSTMHLAKGLEFKAVAVMACDDEVMPLQSRLESASDQSALETIYNTERHLLYVACTRARERLWISGVDPISEFLEDLGGC
jgi:superfamily I DNA/RNA helicase/mRNA-degrading endonuclease RelE of RelBE toxin-antitoxin system